MPERYVELLSFHLEVVNVLETRAYEINDEERIPVIKNWVGLEGQFLYARGKMQNHKVAGLSAKQKIQAVP